MLSTITLGGILKALPLALGFMPARTVRLVRQIPPHDLIPIEPTLPLPDHCQTGDVLPNGRRLIECTEREAAADRLKGRHRRPAFIVPLSANEAAKRFVEFMQAHELVGDREWSGANGVFENYLWHCDMEDLAPLPERIIANALSVLAPKRLVRDRSSGELQRPTIYAIPKAAQSAPEVARKPRAAKGKQRTKPGKAPKQQLRKAA